MEQLSDKIAVVTGAASGIGRAMAERFAAEGMHVVLADVEAGPLKDATEALRTTGARVLAVETDVSDRGSVDTLAAATLDEFGVPNVVCNNAGVSGGLGGAIWETTPTDWEWVMGVNLMGVVHGIQAFVPAMLEAGHQGHIVNTSSVLGLSTGGGSIYSTTKHAVTRLTEGLWYDLRAANSAIGASVLCPGLIATQIVTSGRNRPEHLRGGDSTASAEVAERMQAVQSYFLESGMPPAEVAGMVVDAIRDDRFYVLTHPEMILASVESRMSGILEGTSPPPERPMGDLLGRSGP